MEEGGSGFSFYFILILGGLLAREQGGVEVVYEQHLPMAILSIQLQGTGSSGKWFYGLIIKH